MIFFPPFFFFSGHASIMQGLIQTHLTHHCTPRAPIGMTKISDMNTPLASVAIMVLLSPINGLRLFWNLCLLILSVFILTYKEFDWLFALRAFTTRFRDPFCDAWLAISMVTAIELGLCAFSHFLETNGTSLLLSLRTRLRKRLFVLFNPLSELSLPSIFLFTS